MTSQEAKQDLLRALPKVDELLSHESIKGLDAVMPYEMVLGAVRDAVEAARTRILEETLSEVDAEAIVADARKRALDLMRPSLRPVINATGIVIHTNLGRSPLSKEAADAAYAVARGYSTLEYDTEELTRGSRHDHCENLICALTGAEAAIAVNNNAAACMMVLNEFAAGHEAVVSRGEEVEIGGSFRIPEIMATSNAKMVEVGATNKTHMADYEAAISDETAMLLKVHTSNFSMVGFTESVSIKQLRQVADSANEGRTAENRVLVYEDLGSGCLVKLDCFGEDAEPTVAEHVAQGADLISFSGDKLLGGPQAGIIVGRKEFVDRLKANPLARAMRLDKMTLAALEVTLRQYLDGERVTTEIPTLKMLTEDAQDVKSRAENLAGLIAKALKGTGSTVDIVSQTGCAGGGSMPLCEIPTWCVQVALGRGNALGCSRYLAQECSKPVICRIKNETLLFDARTLLAADELETIAQSLAAYSVTTQAATQKAE